jgi:hypothetical protein
VTLDVPAFAGVQLPASMQANAWTGEDVTGQLGDGKRWGIGGAALAGPVQFMRPPPGADPADFMDERVGWGLVLPDRDDIPAAARARADDAPEPIRALVAARQPAVRVFRYRAGRVTAVTSLRDYAAGKDVAISGSPSGVGDGKLPMYLLLYGGPDVLPWGLQYQLNAGRHVGRLDLAGDPLERYIAALLSGWAGSAARYDAPVVWSVDHGGTDITALMRTQIGAKIADRLAGDQEMPHATFVDGGQTIATQSQLADALATNSPMLIVTTSHGITGPLDNPDQMAAALGLPVDALHATLDAGALLRRWQPGGAIWYAHACCSAGASATSAFAGLVRDGSVVDRVLRGVAAIGPRVAPLPTALLGAASPARAFIGHVQPTFDWTLASPFTGQPLTDSIVSAVYDGLCAGMPVGLAFEGPFGHIGELASAHERAVDEFAEIVQAADSVTAAVYTKLAWLDRQSTVILGDPTAQLALPG